MFCYQQELYCEPIIRAKIKKIYTTEITTIL